MTRTHTKNLDDPDESIRMPGIVEDLVHIGDYTVGRARQDAGWRWSTDMRPIVGEIGARRATSGW